MRSFSAEIKFSCSAVGCRYTIHLRYFLHCFLSGIILFLSFRDRHSRIVDVKYIIDFKLINRGNIHCNSVSSVFSKAMDKFITRYRYVSDRLMCDPGLGNANYIWVARK